MGFFSFLKAKKGNTKQNLASLAMAAPRHLQVGRKSLELIRKTTNPRTFFGRYDDLVFSLQALGQPTCEVTSDVFKSELQIEFIDRLVEAGKLNLLIADLEKYRSRMTQDSLEYLDWVSE